jgi:hypothetical protein
MFFIKLPSRPEMAIHKKYPNEKHEETRYVKELKRLLNVSLNYKLFKKLKEDNLQHGTKT